MFENLRGDLARRRDISLQQGWWQRRSWARNLRALFHVSQPAILAYRFGHWADQIRVPLGRQVLWIAANVFRRIAALLTGIWIIERAEIGPGFVIHTWEGIFIGAVRIGRNFTVETGVVVATGVVSIGDNVHLGAGCKIQPGVKIGNNVVVMPNSLVLTDVRDDTTIVGVPARIRLRGGRPQRVPSALAGKGQDGAPPGGR